MDDQNNIYGVPPSDSTSFPAPARAQTFNYPGGSGIPARQVPGVLRNAAPGSFFLNLLFVGILCEVWACLYPVSAAAGAFSLLYVTGFSRLFVPPGIGFNPNLVASAIGIVVGAIVLWNLSRTEHKLAKSDLYRIPRHLVRLVLIALAVVIIVQRVQGIPMPTALSDLHPLHMLADPKLLGIFLVTLLAAHFFLWNFTWACNFWHRRLVGARLRSPLT